MGDLLSGVLVVGLSQVIGVRLGISFLSLVAESGRRFLVGSGGNENDTKEKKGGENDRVGEQQTV